MLSSVCLLKDDNKALFAGIYDEGEELMSVYPPPTAPTPTGKPQGAASLFSTKPNKGFDFNSFMDMLMVVSPLIERSIPGAGLGIGQAVMQTRDKFARERKAESQALAEYFSRIDPKNHPVAIAALIADGRDPDLVKNAAKLGEALAPKKSLFEQQLEELSNDPVLARVFAAAKATGGKPEQFLAPEDVSASPAAQGLFEVRTDRVPVGMQTVTGEQPFTIRPPLAALTSGSGPQVPTQGVAPVQTQQPIFEERKRVILRGTQEVVEPTLAELGIPLPPNLAQLTVSQAKSLGINLDKLLFPNPQSADQVKGAILAKVAAGEPLTEGEVLIAGEMIFKSKPEDIKDIILRKIAQGQPLTPGERRIYEQVIRKQEAGGVPPVGSGRSVGIWGILSPATRGGESRYRNTETGQVFTRAGAMAVLKQSRDPDLANALGVPRPETPEAQQFKPKKSRQQIAAEIAKIDKRLAQLSEIAKKKDRLTVAQADKFAQEYDQLEARRAELMKLWVPTGR